MIIRRIIAAALVVAALPLAASAQVCPTNADLDLGLIARDGTINQTFHFQAINGRFIQSLGTLRGVLPGQVLNGFPLVTESQYTSDHFLLASDELPIQGVRYDQSLRDISNLFDDKDWQSRISIVLNRTIRRRGVHRIVVLGETVHFIGDCAYETLHLEHQLSFDDGNLYPNSPNFYEFEQWYAPALGIVVAQTGMFHAGGRIRGPYQLDQITAE